MDNIKFSSELEIKYLEDIKSLMFFNPEQQKVVSGILASIERYGLPSVKEINGKIRIQIGELPDVQTIYALDKSKEDIPLVGVIVFFRESKEKITILHIAVKDEYTISSSSRKSFLTIRLIEQLKQIATRIKGIKTLTIFYQKDKIGTINL